MAQNSRASIRIDLDEFKLQFLPKNRPQLTLHFSSPSRRFYLCVIALVVYEMKKLGKIKSIPLQEYLDLIVLLNETVGGAAGSSEKENLLQRIYRKWKDALPNLEEAPLFKVLGKKKEEGDGSLGKIYSFADAEKDAWANLFEYMGSDENVRLKFAIDKMGFSLNEIVIIYGDSVDNEAWDQFISSLRNQTPIRAASLDRMKHPLPDKPSIAVLPFVNISGDKDQEYFSDGITEDLITDLSKVSGLMVIARNSTFTYKGKPVKAKEVAEELGVRYVLEGSVRKSSEEIRINTQLIDALTGHSLWAERYDGTLTKIFAMQDRITRNIISALAVKLTGTEKQIVGDKGTTNIEAYDALIRGMECISRWKPDELARGGQFFKKAIELDPNYRDAHGRLAWCYYWAGPQQVMQKGLGISPIESRLRGLHYLKQALKNPDAFALTLNAVVYLLRRQYKEALSECERSLALFPNAPISHLRTGHVLYCSGKAKEAVDFIIQSIRLDPFSEAPNTWHLGTAHFCAGNLEEAATSYERAIRLAPRWDMHAQLACIYALLGREKEARSKMEYYLNSYKKEMGCEPKLSERMHWLTPFATRAVADRYVEGLIKAGYPAKPSAYFPAFKENRLNGDEIKRVLFGRKITGIDDDGRQWWIDTKDNGEIAWRGGGQITSDKGKSRVVGDMMCVQYENRLWGLEYCQTAFKNPAGTYESKNEYFNCSDWGFIPWSPAR